MSNRYYESLDSIRGLAVLLVVFFHAPLPLFRLDFGWTGVNLFFILSGFLITRILLATKEQPFKSYAASFYMRRMLRIFPLYFAYLMIGVILIAIVCQTSPLFIQAMHDFKRNYIYLLTFTYNFQAIINFLALRSYESSYFLGHLWTLSVEEQFYFLSVFVIYFLNKRVLKTLFVSIVILMPVVRLLFVLILKNYCPDSFFIGTVLYTFTPFQCDAILLGSLLALIDLKKVIAYWKLQFAILLLVFVCAGLWNYYTLSHYSFPILKSSLGFDAPVYHALFNTPYFLINHRYIYMVPIINYSCFLLVALAIQHEQFRLLLEKRWMCSIGKISFSIYMLHLLGACLFKIVVDKFTVSENLGFLPSLILMILYLSLLFLVSFLSFQFYEKRFLRLKRYFPYFKESRQ